MSTTFFETQPSRYRIVEGSSSPAQREYLQTLASRPGIRDVLEIGFNGGLSAAAFLGAPGIRLTSVDIGSWEYVARAKELVDECFPGRHTLVLGDSVAVLPTLPARSFDVVFVDGCHEGDHPYNDLKNAWRVLRDGGVVVLDDHCATYGAHVVPAWTRATSEYLFTESDRREDGDRGWVVGTKIGSGP